MPKVYPKDTYEKRNERKTFQIFLPLLNPDCWEHLGSDHNDHGVDHAFEYIEKGEYRGYRILSQLKSRTNPEVRDGKIVFDFPVKTANYAVGCAQPFLFFFVNLTTREAYYLPLQDYFIANKDKMNALEKNTGTVRVFVPLDNKVEDDELHEIAKSQYTLDDENRLRKVR